VSKSSNLAVVEETAAEPFLKWAGGKRQLLPELLKRVPKNYGQYWEPFLGGGALFFGLESELRARDCPAHLSDSNHELINCWRQVRDDVEGVIELLRTYKYDHKEYLRRRAEEFMPNTEGAARTIYLNRTGFNGLYRVNKGGGFNVPFGRYTNPTICQAERLRACSVALGSYSLLTCTDFRLINPLPGDLVYFDPPYVPLNPTSDFTSYTAEGFTEKDQLDLVWLAGWLKRKGVHVIITNSSAARRLYTRKGFKIETVLGTRRVNSKADQRGAIKELIIT